MVADRERDIAARPPSRRAHYEVTRPPSSQADRTEVIRLSKSPGRTSTDRQILALALPALGALVAEPLFLLADSAIVGRLGTTELAGLGIAAALLTTAVYIFVFLAYGTTSSVARLMGAGERTKAVAIGLDAAWLAAGIGIAVALIGYPAAPYAVDLIGAAGAEAGVRDAAITYLRWALPGIPAMLIVLALVGVLRGLQNTRVTLWIAVTGAIVNALLNLLFVHGSAGASRVPRSAPPSPSAAWRWPRSATWWVTPGVKGCLSSPTWPACGWPAAPASPCSSAPWRCACCCS